MVRMSYEIQSELHLENELKKCYNTGNRRHDKRRNCDLMAAEAMAQKTDASEIKEAIVRIRTLSADEKRKETYDG